MIKIAKLSARNYVFLYSTLSVMKKGRGVYKNSFAPITCEPGVSDYIVVLVYECKNSSAEIDLILRKLASFIGQNFLFKVHC